MPRIVDSLEASGSDWGFEIPHDKRDDASDDDQPETNRREQFGSVHRAVAYQWQRDCNQGERHSVGFRCVHLDRPQEADSNRANDEDADNGTDTDNPRNDFPKDIALTTDDTDRRRAENHISW